MKTNEFDDAVYYRVACECGSDEHDVTIEFEKLTTSTYIKLIKRGEYI